MLITKFAQTDPDKSRKPKYWYETLEGERISCDEDTIEELWTIWIMIASKRDNLDDFNVFIFDDPIEFEI